MRWELCVICIDGIANGMVFQNANGSQYKQFSIRTELSVTPHTILRCYKRDNQYYINPILFFLYYDIVNDSSRHTLYNMLKTNTVYVKHICIMLYL